MEKPITVVITPRDRYSGLIDCLSALYENTEDALFDLIVVDLGYPEKDWKPATRFLESKNNFHLVRYGRIIPMEAMDRVREHIETRYTLFMDNDSRALPNWLDVLLESAEKLDAAVIYPLTLESSGVDAGDEIRTHLFTTEIRVVDYENTPYLIEYKTFRRAKPESLPKGIRESQAFELHSVMFNTDVLRSLEMPKMTIREHLDIGMQLRARDIKLYVEPASQIVFDNLGTRASLSDLRFFNLRWNEKITKKSSDLFQKRWGYRFYSEQSIYVWAQRRKLFMLMRWMFFPIGIANFIDRVIGAIRRRVFPVWDPISDPEGESDLLYDRLESGIPRQLDHSVN